MKEHRKEEGKNQMKMKRKSMSKEEKNADMKGEKNKERMKENDVEYIGPCCTLCPVFTCSLRYTAQMQHV